MPSIEDRNESLDREGSSSSNGVFSLSEYMSFYKDGEEPLIEDNILSTYMECGMVLLLVKWYDIAFIVCICGDILDLLEVDGGKEIESVADAVEGVSCVLNGTKCVDINEERS